MSRDFVAVGAGFVALDIILNREGRLLSRSLGGSCGNILAILSRLGWNAVPFTRLGADSPGRLLLSELRKRGLRVDHVRVDPHGRTPSVIEVLRDPNHGRDHSFLLRCPDCGSYLPRFRSPTLQDSSEILADIPSASVFAFDRLSPAILRMAELYADRGALVFFEPSGVTDVGRFQRAVKASTIVKYAARKMSEALDLETGIAAISGDEPRCEIQTFGSDGLRYRIMGDTREWTSVPAFTCDEVLDTSGAGDWFSAIMLDTLTNEMKSPKAMHRELIAAACSRAQAFAAAKCSFVGPLSMLDELGRDETEEVVKRTMSTGNTSLPAHEKSILPPSATIGGQCSTCLSQIEQATSGTTRQ